MDENKSVPTPENQPPPNQDLNGTQSSETPTKPKRKLPFLKIFIFGFVIIITILAFSLIAYLITGNQTKQKAITTYEECAAAGFPIMESFPEQCAANGQTFTRILTAEEQKKLDSTPSSTPELTPFPTLSASEAATWKTFSNSDLTFKYPSNMNMAESRVSGLNPEIKIYAVTSDQTLMNECMKLDSTENKNGLLIKYFSRITTGEMCSTTDSTPREIWVIPSENDYAPGISFIYSSEEETQALEIFNQILSTFKFTQ